MTSDYQLLPIFESVPTSQALLRDTEPVPPALAFLLSVPPGSMVFALVDAARDLDLAFTARMLGHPMYTLFSGPMAAQMGHVGPCLIPLDHPQAYLCHWRKRLGKNPGILFVSSTDVLAVAAHLRNVFIATDEEGQEYFFRYYDPRVLRVFLPTCTQEELREFFGPVTQWIAENERGNGYCGYRLAGDHLEARDSPS